MIFVIGKSIGGGYEGITAIVAKDGDLFARSRGVSCVPLPCMVASTRAKYKFSVQG